MPVKYNPDKFAVALQLKRQMLGLSQRELAEIVGVTYTTIAAYENGEQAPSMAIFAKICDWLELEPGQFFTKDKPNKK